MISAKWQECRKSAQCSSCGDEIQMGDQLLKVQMHPGCIVLLFCERKCSTLVIQSELNLMNGLMDQLNKRTNHNAEFDDELQQCRTNLSPNGPNLDYLAKLKSGGAWDEDRELVLPTTSESDEQVWKDV